MASNRACFPVQDANKRLTVQEQQVVSDGQGGRTTVWADLETTPKVWAAIYPLSARESFAAQQVGHTTTHRILIRYRADLTPAMRLLYGDREFTIDGMVNVREADEAWELRCTEHRAQVGP